MGSIENFFNDYFLLTAEEASLFDLLRILFSGNVLKREFIQCPEEHGDELEGFRRQWTVFVSVLVQKLLLSMASCMAFTGSVIEMWLNLLTSNGGFTQLLFNLFRGRVVWPDRESPDFTSLLVSLDNRVELDNRIRHGDGRYNSYLSIMASKLSYENEASVKAIVTDHWQIILKDLQHQLSCSATQGATRTQKLLWLHSEEQVHLMHMDSEQTLTSHGISLKALAKFFMRSLGLQNTTGWPKHIASRGPPFFAYYTLREKLRRLLQQNEGAKFILTGHSLGGALSILMAGVLVLHEESWLLDKLEGVYTFGQPGVGEEQFGEYMKEKLKFYTVKYFRYVYCNDMVPRLPDDDKTLLFKHFGSCLYFSSCYKGQILEEEPNKNYF